MRLPDFASISGLDHVAIPTDVDSANATLRRLAEKSRRSFMGFGLAAAAAPAALLATSSTAEAASRDGGLPSFSSGNTTATFQEIQRNEATHVDIIVGAIRSLGGTPRPYPTFTGISNLSSSQFLSLSKSFENTGVSAYFGAAPYISNPNVVAVGLSIALVEAYHSGFINRLAGDPLVPGALPYATPATIQQVVSGVSPFIVSLNDNGQFPASFGTTPSPANDIAILNFALLLEFLEATFYFNNVPRLFS